MGKSSQGKERRDPFICMYRMQSFRAEDLEKAKGLSSLVHLPTSHILGIAFKFLFALPNRGSLMEPFIGTQRLRGQVENLTHTVWISDEEYKWLSEYCERLKTSVTNFFTVAIREYDEYWRGLIAKDGGLHTSVDPLMRERLLALADLLGQDHQAFLGEALIGHLMVLEKRLRNPKELRRVIHAWMLRRSAEHPIADEEEAERFWRPIIFPGKEKVPRV